MTRFLLRPLDWVAFGPPRPSSAGETHHRDSELPSPTTFQGIVRTALLAGSGDNLSDRSRAAQDRRDRLVGGPDSLLPGWQLCGPFLTEIVSTRSGRVARPWVRTPRFLVGSPGDPRVARPIGTAAVEGRAAALNDGSGEGEPILCTGGAESGSRALEGWLSPEGLLWALSGAKGVFDPRNRHGGELPSFVRGQILPGLEIDPQTGIAEDGKLFFNEVLRFKDDAGLAGWLDTAGSPGIHESALVNGELASCGWRSRPAVLEELPPLDRDFQHILDSKHLPDEADEDALFFLTALTPVICDASALNLDSVERAMIADSRWPRNVKARVLASMTGPARVMGGLAAASRRPRPNRSCWDAGSAWPFVLRGGDAKTRADALRVLNDAHPLGSRSDTSLGYGHIIVGIGPKVNKDIVGAAWRRKEARS